MKVEKEYRFLENIDEIRIYNARKKDFYKPTPQEFDIEDIPIQEFINNLPIICKRDKNSPFCIYMC